MTCAIVDCDGQPTVGGFCADCYGVVIPALDRPVITPADEPVQPIHHCRDCDARYHNADAAAQCCTDAATGGAPHAN